MTQIGEHIPTNSPGTLAQIRKLVRDGICSFCGDAFKHNSLATIGPDAQGSIALVDVRCIGGLIKASGMGLYVNRHYDFLENFLRPPSGPRRFVAADIDNSLAGIELPKRRGQIPAKQLIGMLAADRRIIANIDRQLATIEQCAGSGRVVAVNLLDHPWKDDDRAWFERNPQRTHRMRLPFSGEFGEEEIRIPSEDNTTVFLRQVEPGYRLRCAQDVGICLVSQLDDELFARGFFDFTIRGEPLSPDSEVIRAINEKYKLHGGDDA